MGDYDDLALEQRPRSRWPALLAVAALVIGVGLGYLVGTATTEPAPVAPAPAPVGAPPAPAAPSGTPSPCVAIAHGGTDVLAQLDRAARAIGALDPGSLRDVLDEIRRLRDQLQRDVDACQAQLSGASAGG